MDNDLIPSGLFADGIVSLFEDIMTIQFVHRHFAMLVLVVALYVAISEIKYKYYKDAILLLSIVFLQVILGIITLVTVAPVSHIELAVLHQFGAVIVLTVCCYLNARQVTIHNNHG
jgi:heme A synthase